MSKRHSAVRSFSKRVPKKVEEDVCTKKSQLGSLPMFVESRSNDLITGILLSVLAVS